MALSKEDAAGLQTDLERLQQAGIRSRGSGKSGIRGEVGEASEGKVDGHVLRRARWWWFS